MTLTLLLLACTQPNEIKGNVVDIWNQPIEGATVLMEGLGERPLTDEFGTYSMKLVPGEHEVKAGREGYIQEAQTVTLKEGDKRGPDFKLYKKPEETGFYAVTVGDYVKLEAATVKVIGHEGSAVYGIDAPGDDIYVEGDKLKIVYKIDLAMHQLMKLGLEVRKLEWIETKEMVSVTGGQRTPVEIHKFVDAGAVEFDLKKLKSRGHYLIETTEPLESGVYAIQAQDLLTPGDSERWNAIPESLRTVHPITVK